MHSGHFRAAASKAAQSTAFDAPGDPSYPTTTLLGSAPVVGSICKALDIVIRRGCCTDIVANRGFSHSVWATTEEWDQRPFGACQPPLIPRPGISYRDHRDPLDGSPNGGNENEHSSDRSPGAIGSRGRSDHACP